MFFAIHCLVIWILQWFLSLLIVDARVFAAYRELSASGARVVWWVWTEVALAVERVTQYGTPPAVHVASPDTRLFLLPAVVPIGCYTEIEPASE